MTRKTNPMPLKESARSADEYEQMMRVYREHMEKERAANDELCVRAGLIGVGGLIAMGATVFTLRGTNTLHITNSLPDLLANHAGNVFDGFFETGVINLLLLLGGRDRSWFAAGLTMAAGAVYESTIGLHNSFDWGDIAAYGVGCLAAVGLMKPRARKLGLG